MTTRVRRSLIARPKLPKLRPSPPFRSRNPKCSLAEAVTVTLFGPLLNCLLPDRVFHLCKPGLDCDSWTRLAIRTDRIDRPTRKASHHDGRSNQGTHIQRRRDQGATRARLAALVVGR